MDDQATDPMEVLSSTPGELRRIVSGVDESTLRTRPFEGKWTPNEILGHLVDHERATSVRLLVALFEDDPVVGPYQQEAWVAGQRHNERSPRDHLDRFERLRADNLDLLRAATPAQYGRQVRLARGGTVTVEQMRANYARHDLHHLEQLRRYVGACVNASLD
jgi:DinB superfamily